MTENGKLLNEQDSCNNQLSQQIDPDEINLLEYVYAIVKHKWIIIIFTFIGTLGGFIAAKTKKPVWIAEAYIAPKEFETQKTPNLSGMGVFGGIIASQLNITGTANLDKVDQILDSRSFNSELVDKNNLLPLLYRVSNKKEFVKSYDTVNKIWNKDFKQPRFLDLGGFAKQYLKKEIMKNNTMRVAVESPDSTLSDRLLGLYLVFLNNYIRSSVQKDAQDNYKYLDSQLVIISDPLLREKLQSSIATEVEKMMVVSKEAFKIVEPAYITKENINKKIYLLIGGVGLFLATVFFTVIIHAFSSGKKTEEDILLLDRIKKEFRFFKN